MEAVATSEAHLKLGLTFNKPARRNQPLLLLFALGYPTLLLATIGAAGTLTGKPFFSATMLALAPASYISGIVSAFVNRIGQPVVVVEKDGLRVKKRLIRFEQIRSIEARKVSTNFAVVTFADADRTGRLTLLAPCNFVQYRELLSELADKAGVELTLKPEVKERASRIPRPRIPAHS